jgi:hypothetical protein
MSLQSYSEQVSMLTAKRGPFVVLEHASADLAHGATESVSDVSSSPGQSKFSIFSQGDIHLDAAFIVNVMAQRWKQAEH